MQHLGQPPQPPRPSPEYALGWEHGYQAAESGEALRQPEPSKLTWVFAGGSFLGTAAGVASIVLAQSKPDHPLRPLLSVLGVSGMLLGGLLGSLRVLKGEPTPELGIKPPVKK